MHQGIGSVRSGQQYKFGSDRLDASFADEMGAIRRDAILRGRSVETRSSVGESIECDPTVGETMECDPTVGEMMVRSILSYPERTWFHAFFL